MQQGGVLVLAPGGELWFEHADKVLGAHAAVEDVLAAVQARAG